MNKDCSNNQISTSLSQRGYGIVKDSISTKTLGKIKKKLTVAPFQPGNFGVKPTPFILYMDSPSKLYVPRYFGLLECGKATKNTLKLSNSESLRSEIIFQGSLRQVQLEAQKAYLEGIKNTLGGGLINLPCGYGKTILALGLISNPVIRKKTLIVVHKEFLLHQWKERIKTFLPEAKIGVIQQKKIEIDGFDIVIGMLQSIAMKQYPKDTFSVFGFVIIDECHHLGAEVFSRALPKINSSYMLGLSATPDRKDGLRCVFEWYIGPMLYQIESKNTDTVWVEWWQYSDSNPQFQVEEKTLKGTINTPKMITRLCEWSDRTDKIIQKIETCYKEGRKILVLSDRRGHLDDILQRCLKNELSVGCYIGGMTRVELALSEEKRIILGTYAMASEGMDIPALNTVILATPKSDVKQSVGRIFRQQVKDRTHIPLIIDIVDQIPNFVRQSSKRKTLYRKCGYIFKYLDKDLNPLDILTPKKSKNTHKQDVSELDRHTSLKFSSCLFDSDDD